MRDKSDLPDTLTRREMIESSARWLGATLTSLQFGALSTAIADIVPDAAPRFLDNDQFAALTAICDLIVPETETPGALAAGAHYFIDLLLDEWASTARQARYVAGLAEFDRLARDGTADGFCDLSPEDRLTLLQSLDDKAYDDEADFPFYLELKKMVLFAYYTSEPGATRELRFQRIPGSFEPCLPLEGDDRAWFWNGYSYGL